MGASGETVVRTSDPHWLEALARVYKSRASGLLVDDANLGIDPGDQTLLQMARLSGISKRELAGACVALGMSAAGVVMVVLAFVDPEPTSKLGLLVGGGVACVLSGGLSAIRILTKHKPPNVRITARGFEILW